MAITIKRLLFIFTIQAVWLIQTSFAATGEFRSEVRVDNSQVESGRSNVFDELEQALEEYINEQQWTNLNVQQNERIECNFTLTITEWDRDNDEFRANLQVQAVRPVFNSGYNTTLINHLDEEIEFEYASHVRLEYIQGSHINELSSVIAFYLYYIIGKDLDSFAPGGGTDLFNQAMNIASTAQSGDNPGWRPFESDRNRHGLAHNILESRNEKFREGWYIYHRKGMDVMAEDPEKGRAGMLEALKTIREFHRRNPNAYLLRIFFRAKSAEIINAFSQASATERNEILDLLQTMDPRNSQEYRRRLR